ncbi:MAG: flippase-like domain-containing protein [Chloroflexi bacterium]|nr:flippase-like domain-containing protein [Chloroflexota bacterium]
MDIDADAAERRTGERGFFSSRLFAAVRIIASLAILAGLIFKLSPGELSSTFRDADLLLLLAVLGLMVVVQALVVVKWMLLLRARDVDPPLLQVVRAYCVGNLLSTVLPTAVGGDVYRVYRVQREAGARAADVTMSVLYERATGYAAMTCFGALGAAFYYGNAAIGFLTLAAGASAALVLAFVLPRLPFPAVREDHFLRNLLAHRRELMAVYQMAVFSLVIQALFISSIALTGRAFGAHVSWWYWAFTTWVVAVAVLLPITLGGLGVRESSFSALIKHAGGTAAQGASTGFALGLLLIVVNATGLLAVEVAERLGFGAAAAPESPAGSSREAVHAERA